MRTATCSTARPRTRDFALFDRSPWPGQIQEARPAATRDVHDLRAGPRMGRMTAVARGRTGEDENGRIAEKDGDATTDAAKTVAGKEISPIDAAEIVAGKEIGRTSGTDAARPTLADLQRNTETGAGLLTQPLGGSSRGMRPEPGPESPDPAKRKAEDAGTSASGALQVA